MLIVDLLSVIMLGVITLSFAMLRVVMLMLTVDLSIEINHYSVLLC